MKRISSLLPKTLVGSLDWQCCPQKLLTIWPVMKLSFISSTYEWWRYIALQAAPQDQGRCQAPCDSAQSGPSACFHHKRGIEQCFRCEFKKLDYRQKVMPFCYRATRKCCLRLKWRWLKCLLTEAAWVHSQRQTPRPLSWSAQWQLPEICSMQIWHSLGEGILLRYFINGFQILNVHFGRMFFFSHWFTLLGSWRQTWLEAPPTVDLAKDGIGTMAAI